MEKNIFNYNYINEHKYRYIKNRIGEKVALLLSNIKKVFPNADIYICGSVIDFTFIKDISDTDCLIKCNNDNDKTKIIDYITQQKDIKHLNNSFYTFSDDKKNIRNIIQCEFDNEECIDIYIVNDDILSIRKKELSRKGITKKIYHYILKVLYKKKKLIDKSTFDYFKNINYNFVLIKKEIII
jgi:hypothetical protein